MLQRNAINKNSRWHTVVTVRLPDNFGFQHLLYA